MGKRKWTTELIKKHIEENHPNTEIMEEFEYTSMQNIIKIKCKKCNKIYEKSIHQLIYSKESCSYCSGKYSHTIQELKEIIENKFKNITLISTSRGKNKNSKLTIKCNLCKHEWDSSIDTLINGSTSCPKCGNKKMRTIEEAIIEIEKLNPTIKVLKYTKTHDPVICECKIDGYTWNATGSALLNTKKSIMCPVCNGVVVSDKNRLSILRPDVLKYMKYPEDANNLTVKSSKVIELKCPNCGTEKIGNVSNLTTHPFACGVCGSGASVAEKFTRAILNQLNIEHHPEYSPKWEGLLNRRYDIFIPSKTLVIEVMGKQHFNENSEFSRTLEEEIQNDLEKKIIALNNNCDYDLINAYHTDFKWLKENIKLTLSKYFDLSNVNWEDAFSYTSTSIMSDCWELYKLGYMVKEISQKLNIRREVVWRYLKQGDLVGKIEYVKNRNPYK